MRRIASSLFVVLGLALAPSVGAKEVATVTRLDAGHVSLAREEAEPVTVWLSTDASLDAGDERAARWTGAEPLELALPAEHRRYVILQGDSGETAVVAERVLPLAQGSNFRDIGGYMTGDGREVRWGRAFRSAAMPLLSEADKRAIQELGIDSVVDLRSLDEREITPDTIDDETGALFLANDYRMAKLMEGLRAGGGENIYKGMEVTLAPQYRALYRRIMAGEGAVIYHCSAGQDRTGVATALLYDMLGVDRKTILADYHLSTELRRPEWEFPKIDPADFPGNTMAAMLAKAGERKSAAPLYTPGGQSHLAQFFAYVDETYGSSEGYMQTVLGFDDADIATLRAAMLD
ncbi:protein tyrosine phosphatase [Novosphingobium sp. PC22D]|uniref:tyrosine-protein phosphatase n=1 Tax=Novosphingobium sp. PC22D TaxID=1962403 RepID=UPI000BEFA3DC|nr:tyrosine-protein phosphatase [Novosphingobium sp. PC22D]PEQ14705.1 protein tyrosine phosphatase [Novosphingobium sp. PC22D]